ncbi:unnamed protein product [Prorocentrum cordatum]|uniref:Mei2-like C-terminal RNA recognition motif domain-containing protein n=1 Tax=Prorocentrum cordatum TaxID=2364126 RepID=A0ABN9YHD3_9DINO|nr:unnamed protein product [Polarella glacialis]
MPRASGSPGGGTGHRGSLCTPCRLVGQGARELGEGLAGSRARTTREPHRPHVFHTLRIVGFTRLFFEMAVILSIKNTFVCASFEDSGSAGLRRSSSCPSLRLADATLSQDASSTDIVSTLASSDSDLTLTGLGTWADIDSDFDEQESPSCLSLVGLRGLGCSGEAHAPLTVDEKSPAAPGFTLDGALAKMPERTRTPLSSKASAFSPLTDSSAPHVPFVPASSLSSRASAFVPRSSQTVSMPARATAPPEAKVPRSPSQSAAVPQEVTTAMLRNLPCGFTRNHLRCTLDSNGLAGLYDFVYVPIDFERGLCKGYGFVNLVDAKHLQRLNEVFEGYSEWSHFSSSKVCQVSLSHTQGLMANVERYRNSPVMCGSVPEDYKPVVFLFGAQVDFPAPVKKLRPPRLRKGAARALAQQSQLDHARH